MTTKKSPQVSYKTPKKPNPNEISGKCHICGKHAGGLGAIRLIYCRTSYIFCGMKCYNTFFKKIEEACLL